MYKTACRSWQPLNSVGVFFVFMGIEIVPVGGWGEIGRNMTAVRVDEEVFIFDMGLHMPNYIRLTDEEIGEFRTLTEASLKRADAVPQDGAIKDLRQNVVAIVVTHAHLDHIGSTPYLAQKYDAPVICTPFSAHILRTICRDERIDFSNRIVELKPGQSLPLGKSRLEFCNITHSTPQTVIATLHTPHGVVVYGNDYKLDIHPTLGTPVNFEHFKKLGEKGVAVLIQDCLYAPEHRKTPSEQIAKDMLKEVLVEINKKGKGIIVTTFSSHIARLKSIAEFGRLINRKVVFMGRSIAKYCCAATDTGITDFNGVEIIKFARQISRRLKEVQVSGKEKYLLVVSGHQGEPKSALSKMIDGVYPWNFDEDSVVYSCTVIPAEINRLQRSIMEEKLKKLGARIFRDIHVSGHSSREDLREIIELLKPKQLFPTHGEPVMMDAFRSLAVELGYEVGKNLHLLTNGQRKVL